MDKLLNHKGTKPQVMRQLFMEKGCFYVDIELDENYYIRCESLDNIGCMQLEDHFNPHSLTDHICVEVIGWDVIDTIPDIHLDTPVEEVARLGREILKKWIINQE